MERPLKAIRAGYLKWWVAMAHRRLRRMERESGTLQMTKRWQNVLIYRWKKF